MPGNGSALSFTRHFNLIEPLAKSNMGYGWSHTYARWVKAPPYDTQATVRRPNGTEYNFRYSVATSTWVSDADVTDRLVERLDGSGLRIGWRYTSSSDEVERYDLEGRLLSITDRAGRTLSLDYSTLETLSSTAPTVGLLIKVKDTFGHVLKFTYDANSRLATMTDSSGGVFTYAYSAYTYAYIVYDHLVSVTYPDNTSKTYLYENNASLTAPHALTGILDANGNRTATWTYASDGRAASSEHALGTEKYTIAYTRDATRNVIRSTVTDAVGTVNTYNFQTILGVVKNTGVTQTCAGCVSSSATTSYDVNGNVASRTDFNGNRTDYTYDLARNLETSRTEGLTSAGANTAVTRTINTTWHPSYRIPSSVTGAGRATTFTHDADGNILSMTVGAAPLNTRTVSMTYNASGQVTSIDGPRTDVADVTTLAYYDCNTGGGCGQLQRATNALGHTTTYDSYDDSARLLQLTDPNGVKTAYAYDARGRVLSLTQTTPGGDRRMTRYGYDAAGNVITTLLPSGLSLTNTYDAANYLRRVTDNLGNYIDYGYDLKGNRTQTYTYDTSGTLVRAVDLAFNPRNRITQLNTGGSITKQVWDAMGSLTQVTNPNTVAANGTAATHHSYDALSRLMTSIDLMTGTTQYTYDPQDRLKSVSAPNGASTQYQYDNLGNLMKEVSPDRGTLTYAYDPAGNLTQQTDARGTVSTYTTMP